MIRRAYIERLVLDIYRSMPEIKFPLDLNVVASLLPECRLMSYQKLADNTSTTVDDIIAICQSRSGCTHYDSASNRYLILFNKDEPIGRKRWTIGHEIGHVMCKHHILARYNQLSENNLLKEMNADYEAEADYFSAMLLAPFPLFKTLHINSPRDIQNVFGLSAQAAEYRMNSYIGWINMRKKSAWENDMNRVFKSKSI